MTNSIKESIEKGTEIVFVFDTTGSMSPAISNVKKHIEKTCEELFQDIPNLKVGFIAHGDYCDRENCYQLLTLTDDRKAIYDFIRNVKNTGGGDAPECYELALNLAKGLGWSDAKGGKVVVMIGDATPHEIDYELNKDKLDWRKELKDLNEMGINVYPLQCLYSEHRKEDNSFWEEIGAISGTPLVRLDDFNEASDVMGGYAAASSGTAAFTAYEAKVACCAASPSTLARNAILRGETHKYD